MGFSVQKSPSGNSEQEMGNEPFSSAEETDIAEFRSSDAPLRSTALARYR